MVGPVSERTEPLVGVSRIRRPRRRLGEAAPLQARRIETRTMRVACGPAVIAFPERTTTGGTAGPARRGRVTLNPPYADPCRRPARPRSCVSTGKTWPSLLPCPDRYFIAPPSTMRS